jgi:hypothetical protein
METRSITQYKVYVLYLNPMSAHTEAKEAKLIAYYNSEKAPEPYSEEGAPTFECHGDSHTWNKIFKKGSPLEWYNPVWNNDFSLDRHGHGIYEAWIDSEFVTKATQ